MDKTNGNRRSGRAGAASVQTYARVAGALFLINVVAGGFGEAFVPSALVVSADATKTAHNILASESLFRLGFASYLVEALSDITLTLLLYVLLKRVHQELALLAVFFRLVSTATFAATELFSFSALLILRGADHSKTFTPEQFNTLASLLLEISGYGAGIFMVFYGVAAVVFGYLIVRSGYLPKLLGALLALGGFGFVIRNFVLVLAPAYASIVLVLPMMLAVICLTVWLLVRGVDVAKWEEERA